MSFWGRCDFLGRRRLGLVVFRGRNRCVVLTARTRAMAANIMPEYPATAGAADPFNNGADACV